MLSRWYIILDKTCLTVLKGLCLDSWSIVWDLISVAVFALIEYTHSTQSPFYVQMWNGNIWTGKWNEIYSNLPAFDVTNSIGPCSGGTPSLVPMPSGPNSPLCDGLCWMGLLIDRCRTIQPTTPRLLIIQTVLDGSSGTDQSTLATQHLATLQLCSVNLLLFQFELASGWFTW